MKKERRLNKKQVWYLISMLLPIPVMWYFMYLIVKSDYKNLMYLILITYLLSASTYFWYLLNKETERRKIKSLLEEPPIILGSENETKIERIKPFVKVKKAEPPINTVNIIFGSLDEDLQKEFNEWYSKVKIQSHEKD